MAAIVLLERIGRAKPDLRSRGRSVVPHVDDHARRSGGEKQPKVDHIFSTKGHREQHEEKGTHRSDTGDGASLSSEARRTYRLHIA